MKTYPGISASPGLVVGQVSRLEWERNTFSHTPLNPEKEQTLLEGAIRTAQAELQVMQDGSAESEQAIFMFQSMLLEDEGFMSEVRSYITAGIGAAAAMERVGQRYADQMSAMVDNPYMQLRGVDILDVTQRVINILGDRPRTRLALDHPVILATEVLMPSDFFSIPSGMVLGVITSEGSTQSHAAIIARAMKIPAVVQVGRAFLDDCDGRMVVLDADNGVCILDPDSASRQQMVTRMWERQQENAELARYQTLPNRTWDGASFELLANCFGPEDIESSIQAGAAGVGLLRSSYLMLPDRVPSEQEQYFFYTSCLSVAKGRPITVRTFDLGSDRTLSNAYQGAQSAHLGLRGIRSSLLRPREFEAQICALLRAGARGPLKVMFPMVTDIEDWDAAMKIVEHCRQSLRERGVAFDENMSFGITLAVPAACLTADEFIRHGCQFFTIGTNDLTQYTHAAGREVTSAARYYQPASRAMRKLIKMVVDAAHEGGIPVTICGLAVGDPVNIVEYLRMGLRSFSVSPQNLWEAKKALVEAYAEQNERLPVPAEAEGPAAPPMPEADGPDTPPAP